MRLVDLIRTNVRQLAGRRAAARPRRRRRYLVEGLEGRALLTSFFTPQDGAQVVDDAGGPRLSTDPGGTPLYSIFWGSYWDTSDGRALRSDVQRRSTANVRSGCVAM